MIWEEKVLKKKYLIHFQEEKLKISLEPKSHLLNMGVS
jgi:hypothetical protein